MIDYSSLLTGSYTRPRRIGEMSKLERQLILQGLFIKMSKSAWVSSNCDDFQTILGPVFTLFRCFGIDFHEPSINYPRLYRVAMVGWTLLTLGTCGFRLMFYFPSVLIGSDSGSPLKMDNSTSFLHWSIEFLNHWIYILAVFIGTWCMAR